MIDKTMFENLNIEVENRKSRWMGRFFFVMGIVFWGMMLPAMGLLTGLWGDMFDGVCMIFLLSLGSIPMTYAVGLIFFGAAVVFGGIVVRISSITLILTGLMVSFSVLCG